MEEGENHESPRYCIEVNVPKGERKLAVVRLHHGDVLQIAVEDTVALHYKTVCFNQLFGDTQYQSKMWTHLLIQGFFFTLTIFYIV